MSDAREQFDDISWYDQFTFMELADTKTFLEAAGLQRDDSVLVTCCGPGRETIVAAQLARKVTAFDKDERMLSAARQNASKRNLYNIDFRRMGWESVLPGQNMKKHDVVLALRNPAMRNPAKLSALANRKVVLQVMADAPFIPQLIDIIYDGCPAPDAAGTDASENLAGSPSRPTYLELMTLAHDAGFMPNARILPERWRRTFTSHAEARAFLCGLKPERSAGHEDRVMENCTPFLTAKNGGIEFCIESRAAIIWWDL